MATRSTSNSAAPTAPIRRCVATRVDLFRNRFHRVVRVVCPLPCDTQLAGWLGHTGQSAGGPLSCLRKRVVAEQG